MTATTSVARRLVAEGLGTAVLVATVVGSGIMAERLADGNQAIALLGNTIPTGAILVVIITIFGPVSGAHFNPAVTLVFAARRETPWAEVAPYIVVQCLGGIAGTALAHLTSETVTSGALKAARPPYPSHRPTGFNHLGDVRVASFFRAYALPRRPPLIGAVVTKSLPHRIPRRAAWAITATVRTKERLNASKETPGHS